MPFSEMLMVPSATCMDVFYVNARVARISIDKTDTLLCLFDKEGHVNPLGGFCCEFCVVAYCHHAIACEQS